LSTTILGWGWIMNRSSTKPLLAVALVVLLGAVACSAGVSTNGANAPTPTAPTTPATAAPSTTAAPPAAKPSPGCGTSTVRAVDKEQHDFDVAGTNRFYLLTTPAAHDGKKAPPPRSRLPRSGRGRRRAHRHVELRRRRSQEGRIRRRLPHGAGQPCPLERRGDPNANQDVAYVDKLLDTLGTDLCIDTSRVYATGLSYGAIMSSYLTCVRAQPLRRRRAGGRHHHPAVGMHAQPTMPVMAFHGTRDPILLFNGGVDLSALGAGSGGETTTTKAPDLSGPGYPANVAAWAARNGLQADTDRHQGHPREITKRVYDCPADAAVEFYIISGGGPRLAGSVFSQSIAKVVGPTTMDIDATDLTWQFFKRFRLKN